MSVMSLAKVFEGWEGYNTSLVHAIDPLTPEQLSFRAVEGARSVGEIAAHIALGRIDWFNRMKAPGAVELAAETPKDSEIAGDSAKLVHWLQASWKMVEGVLNAWTTDDLPTTYLQPYQGQTYAVSHQWVLWRIMAHDIQHGGQLTVLLEMQGIVPTELTWLGGHLTEPPLAEGE